MATLVERMKAVAEAEKAAGVHYTQTGRPSVTEVGVTGQYVSPASRAYVPPEPEPFMPEYITRPDGSMGYFDPQGNWVQITMPYPEYPELEGYGDISDWLAQNAPQPTTYEPLTMERLIAFVSNSMMAETQQYQDPKTGEIITQHVYTNEDIRKALNVIYEHTSVNGFGPQTPYYGAAQQYYAQIAQVEASFNTAGMSASDYMQFQLAIMQMVNDQDIARFQAEVGQTMWGAQLQLSYGQLAQQLQTAMLPYEQMTAYQQAQLEQAGAVTPAYEAQLGLERELAYLPYEQQTMWQQTQADLQQQEMELARERMALEEQLAMLPYQGMTASQQAQLEQQILQREAEIDLAHQQLAQQMQLAQLPYQGMTAWQQEQAELQQQQLAQEMQMAQLPYEQMTAYQEAYMAQEQQNYLANLRAQPQSWLEYSAAAGETPAIQPWMQPLMPQQYEQLGAGQAIPGYQGTEGMTGMPQLTTPSRQYQARMGPTAMRQYQGYQQAQTGAPPEETQWRLWSMSPPAGQFGGLRYGR